MDSSPVVTILQHPESEAQLRVDAAFRKQYGDRLEWLLDRLARSTAGVRGLLAGAARLSSLSLVEAERSPQLSPGVVAVIAQAYAAYFLRRGGEAGPAGVFVGFDARFLSREYGELFTRVLAGNGIPVARDRNGESTPTPVSSFMAVSRGLGGAIQITASHNPPNYNGIKSSTDYGGVDTDDISDAIAAEVRRVAAGGSIRFAALPSPLVQEVDAKGEYARLYLRATFPEGSLAPLASAVRAGMGFLFDGLHGVGGRAMERYLDELLPGAAWRTGVRLLNAEPDPTIGGIEKPDPSDPETLVASGAIDYLASRPETLVSVTADMDGDRIGTAVVIQERDVERARRYGLFVSRYAGKGGTVWTVRFTPNQVFTLIAYERLLSARREGAIRSGNVHLVSTIATSCIVRQLAERHGVQLHLTAVGFKNLGRTALELDRRGDGAVILALLEESGGAQIGPFRPWNERGDTIHRDKDTCTLALALFNLAARLHSEGRSLLDFYLEMAGEFGALAYFERLDAYLPDRAAVEDPARAEEASAAKEHVLARLMALSAPAGRDRLLAALGYDPRSVVAEEEATVAGVRLLVNQDGAWQTISPTARRYRLGDGRVVELYRGGVAPHDGTRINVYRSDGALSHWCLVRASGTEAVLRAYLEVMEPVESPDPLHLVSRFGGLLRALELDQYGGGPGGKDLVSQFEASIRQKYGV